MEAAKEYIISIRDRTFVLFDDQIRRDAPNYFTNYFEGFFKESQCGVLAMKLNRDPHLFTFIHSYLSGYEIFPLPKDNIPDHFSEESRLKNLLLDARFYGLDTLAEELEAIVNGHSRSDGEWSLSEADPERKEMWKILSVSMFTLDRAPQN
jgi:hypothetical protein